VICVLVNGQPQRELPNGTVIIPFNTTYSLRFRNKHNRRAVVKFTIDGENVSGNGYVIPANSHIDIHRHWNKDAGFVFVDLDSPQAVDAGKNGPNITGEKGLIEAVFSLEKYQEYFTPQWVPPSPQWVPPSPQWIPPSPQWVPPSPQWVPPSPQWVPPSPQWIPPSPQLVPPSLLCSTNANVLGMNNMKDGCTVEGAATYQNFSMTYLETEFESTRLRLMLKSSGVVESIENLIYCTNCGAKKLRKNDNFCGVCGKKF
jgi:hypothetical protein